jgi:hypothetical protein
LDTPSSITLDIKSEATRFLLLNMLFYYNLFIRGIYA